MSAKSKKDELNEEFIAMSREKQSRGMSRSLYIKTEMKKTKV